MVEVEPIRQYLDDDGPPRGSPCPHVLGYTGPVSREELERLETQGYLRDDVIGETGVEASFEDELRGAYGSQLVERDASGAAGRRSRRCGEPVPGTNLMLTIDAEIQRQATQALTWGMDVADVSQGVTVVMNPQTGEILAMVSLPAYDNNNFAGGISTDDFSVYLADPNKPLRNHAISDIYPPGSTFKLVTAIAAMEEGVTTADREWPTYGCYQIPGAPEGRVPVRLERPGFGPLAMVDAFAKSSDTFFYQMAVPTGIDPLADGRTTSASATVRASACRARSGHHRQHRMGAAAGARGRLHRRAGAGRHRPERRIAATPLQVLNAYAAVANGGQPDAADDRPRRDRCGRATSSASTSRAPRTSPPIRERCRPCASAHAR